MLVTAYYAEYHEGHLGSRDRIGGLPTHLPIQYPTCSSCGVRLAFFMQLYVDKLGLFSESWLALQLYACTEEACFESRLTAIGKGAELNDSGVGVSHPDAHTKDISWVRRDDPDPLSYADNVDSFWEDETQVAAFPYINNDKLGGCFAWCDEGGTTGYRLGAIGQFKNPIRSPTNQCSMIYLFKSPERGLSFEFF